MKSLPCLPFLFLLFCSGDSAVITGVRAGRQPFSQAFLGKKDWADSSSDGFSRREDGTPPPSHLRLQSILAGKLKIVPKACDRDLQCGGGMCCAVSLWIQSLRICTPMGIFGEDCHPLSHKVPFWGRRMHHSCPCEPNLACVQISPSKYKCLPEFKNDDIYF